VCCLALLIDFISFGVNMLLSLEFMALLLRSRHASGVTYLLVLVGLMSTVGCSDKIAVTGQVSLNNTPVEDGTITFVPVDGKGPSAGNLIHQGQYSVEVLPGKKLVRIEGYKTVGTIKMAIGPKPIDAPDKRRIVPKQYNSESKLEVDVDSSHREHNFTLEGKVK
jgi:hypothetical protein